MSRILMMAAVLGISPSVRVMSMKLDAALREEANAVNRYELYSKKAAAENYHEVSKLFHAAAVSEHVQAENHRAALSALSRRPAPVRLDPVTVRETRENLKMAMGYESRMRLTWYGIDLAVQAPAADVVEQSFDFARDAGLEREKLFWSASVRLGEVALYSYYVSRISGKIRVMSPGSYAPAPRSYTDDYFEIR